MCLPLRPFFPQSRRTSLLTERAIKLNKNYHKLVCATQPRFITEAQFTPSTVEKHPKRRQQSSLAARHVNGGCLGHVGLLRHDSGDPRGWPLQSSRSQPLYENSWTRPLVVTRYTIDPQRDPIHKENGCDAKKARQQWGVCAHMTMAIQRRPLPDVTMFNLLYNSRVPCVISGVDVVPPLPRASHPEECQKVQCLDYIFDISLTFSEKCFFSAAAASSTWSGLACSRRKGLALALRSARRSSQLHKPRAGSVRVEQRFSLFKLNLLDELFKCRLASARWAFGRMCQAMLIKLTKS